MSVKEVPSQEPINGAGVISNVWVLWFKAFRTFVNDSIASILTSLGFVALPDNLLWEDLRFPAQGINPAGSTAPPAVDTGTGLLSFAGNADNIIAGVAQMPHEWAIGTSVSPHIHLRFATANTNNSRWKFEYDIASVNGNFTNTYGTFTTLATVTATNPNNAKKHVLVPFGTLAMTGFNESSVISWRITRLAASDAADNDTSEIKLLEFDIHYQIGKGGTPTEMPT